MMTMPMSLLRLRRRETAAMRVIVWPRLVVDEDREVAELVGAFRQGVLLHLVERPLPELVAVELGVDAEETLGQFQLRTVPG